MLHLLKNKKSIWKETYDEDSDSYSNPGMTLREKLLKMSELKLFMDSDYMVYGLKNQQNLSAFYQYVVNIGYYEQPDYGQLFNL